MLEVSTDIVKRLSLYKQGLYHSPVAQTPDEALTLLRRLGYVQLDTLNVVTRSHNLVFLARMAAYEEGWVWDFYKDPDIMEAYMHELCIIPTGEQRHWWL